ncbi:MAG: IPTL-CTERM sorting domain-containing protein [Candidatus Latescibacter sp.]|nr:IPTL-CTERM sorting domain-containing protein [Candidatus Latescibacter sp.]
MIKKWVIVFVMAAMAAMLVWAGNGFALTTTWTGGTDTDWATAGNWGAGVPGAGDTAIIPFVASLPTVPAGGGTCLNLQINTTGGVVTITLAGNLTIPNGGSITVTAGGNASNITGGGSLVQGGTDIITNNSTGLFTISCFQITNTGASLTTFAGTGNTTVTAAIIEGSGTPITKSGAGTLALNGANTFIGALTINTGTVELGHISAFGSGAGGITMTGGILKVTVAGGINAGNWTPLVNLTGNAAIEFAAAGTTIDTAISVGNGFVLTIQGNSAATFTGGIIGAGGVTINMAANQVIAITSAAWAYTGDTTLQSGFITTNAAGLLTSSGTYLLSNNANAKITTAGVLENIGSLSGGGAAGGNIVLGGAMTINQTTNTTYSGIISGSGVLRKIGAGTLKLAGVNTYIGATNVDAGILLVNASQSVAGAFTISNANTTLGGTGNLGNNAVTIAVGAIVKPGDGGVGTLTTTGPFTFQAGSKLIVDIVNATKDLLAVNTLNVAATSIIQLEPGYIWASGSDPYQVVTATTYDSSGGNVFTTSSFPAFWSITSTTNSDIKINGGAPGIPTLTEWGLILFALFIAAFAIWSIRRKNYKAA